MTGHDEKISESVGAQRWTVIKLVQEAEALGLQIEEIETPLRRQMKDATSAMKDRLSELHDKIDEMRAGPPYYVGRCDVNICRHALFAGDEAFKQEDALFCVAHAPTCGELLAQTLEVGPDGFEDEVEYAQSLAYLQSRPQDEKFVAPLAGSF